MFNEHFQSEYSLAMNAITLSMQICQILKTIITPLTQTS